MKNIITIGAALLAAYSISATACKKDLGKTLNKGESTDLDFHFVIDSNYKLPVKVLYTNESKRATTFKWEFGDGATSTEENPTHIYTVGGTMKVKLVVGNGNWKDSIVKEVGIAGGTVETANMDWQEHWGEHVQLVKRVYLGKNAVVYYDKDMNPDVKWPFAFLDTVWGYTKKHYGEYGKNINQDDRLFAIFHTDKYGGGHPAAYFDDHHDFRNVLDCGTGGGAQAWKEMAGWNIGVLVHEISHIVEGASNGVKESPAFDIWGDSKWAEIFVYDVYKGIGLAKEAQEVYDELMVTSDNFPRAGTQWFRDWFYPIYSQYGEVRVLDKYFKLLAAHFPQSPFQNIKVFNRRMTWGEYIHFTSGAAGVNLQPMAAKAFGWPAEWTTQLQNAKANYPGITYTGIGDALVIPVADVNISGGATLMVGQEHPDGPNANEGSSKMKDGNQETKFYLANYNPGFWATYMLNAPDAANSYTITTGDDASERDPKDFELQGSNNNTSWTTLDTQSVSNFNSRKGTYRFRFTNTTPYLFYRLVVKSVRNGGSMQLSDWQIWKTN